MIRKIAMAMAVVTAGFSFTACEMFPPACEGLSVSQQDRDAAANGYEVERTDSLGNECELSQDGNSWSVDS